MDSFNQIYFNLETPLPKEEYELMFKQMQKEKSKSLLILNGEEVFCKIHSFVLEEEFDETLTLFVDNQLRIPNNSNLQLINVLSQYFYFKEIKDLSFPLVFDLLSLSIFFRLGDLFHQIIGFLKKHIVDYNRVIFILKKLFPIVFQKDSDTIGDLRLLFDDCERFLLKGKFFDEFFDIAINEVLKKKINIENELLHHIELMKEAEIESVYILKLLHYFIEKLDFFKKQNDKDFDCSKYFAKLIELHIDFRKIDKKIFDENIALLNLDKKEFESKRLEKQIAFLESESKTLREEMNIFKKE